MKTHILAIGVHPDDVELGCSGAIIQSIRAGKTVVIADLTQGELGSRGTPETRYAEAAEAARIMGVDKRENLKLRDGFFSISEESTRAVIQLLRTHQPELVLCNAPKDRHPDHGRSSQLVQEACFLSGLRKIETLDENGVVQEPWRPKQVYHYMQDLYLEPDFMFDISEAMDQKIASILAYKTQFNVKEPGDEPATYISDPAFVDALKSRARLLGKRIGVKYAEGYLTDKTPGIRSFDAFINQVR